MKIGRRPRLAAILATSLGGVLVAGALAFAPGSAGGETLAAADPIAPLGWAVTNLSSGAPQTDDAVAADADGSVVAVRWRPCTGTSCRPESHLRISTDAGRTFGPLRTVDDSASAPIVAVAGVHVLTASSGRAGSGKPVVRVNRWSGGATGGTPQKVEIATTASPTNLRLAASGNRAVLAYRVASDVFVARTGDGGATWSTPSVVEVGNGQLDVDVDGDEAVVVSATGADTWSVRASSDAGTTWGAPHSLVVAGGGGATPRVAITAGGRIALGLSYAEGGSRRGEVRTSTDGVTWSTPTKLASLSATQTLDLAAEGGTFFAGGDGLSLHRSTGDGSWSRIGEYRRVVWSSTAHVRQFASTGRSAVAVSANGPLVMHGSTLLRSFPDTRTPSVRFTAVPPAVTKVANQVVRFAATDADAADAWLTYECGYGSNAGFEECSSPHQISRWSPEVAGRKQELRVRAIDAAGRVSPVVTARWILDQVPPVHTFVRAKEVVLTSRAMFRWGAEEHESSVASYQVRYSVTAQTAARMSRAWRTPRALARTTRRSVILAVPRGKVVCVQMRATDRAGNVSAWTRQQCAARPYDDRALARSGSTKRLRDKRFVDGSATRLRARGTVTLRGVQKRSEVVVVLKREPGRRGITIHRPGVKGTTFIGAAGRRKFGVVRTAPGPTQRRTGPVRLSGDAVIDGLVMLPRWAYGVRH
ncbi:glycoside hydrolase [Mumia sp. zg.B21]|uniref:WD40/YVTN/BNR-like repeat-containing protein n=1 Tax=unclassified Mumia TaxID=2621872 RepID=UPI001C6F53F3|nr:MULTISPECIES: sialidase family protein [unclassified Mumia]MBW9211549.1 glycoside hydrolase [Mumia sp. zg.B21]MDD9349718.1 sialidase family protein [Mumia sp.]